jgi:uncharacterized protein DUF4124
MRLFWILIALSGVFITDSVQAKIYRWVDESGKVHFSDKKSKKYDQTTVKPNIHKSTWKRFDISVNLVDVKLSQDEVERIQRDVNNVYQFYDQIMFFDFYKTVPVKIHIESNRNNYYQHLRQLLGREPSPSNGMYIRKGHQIVVYIREDRNGTLETIKHEANHAIIDSIVPSTPTWLNEGLAEQMETLVADGETLVIHRHPANSQQVNRQQNLLSLRQLLDLQNGEWRKLSAKSNFILQAQSGELVYFLLSSNTGRSFISRVLHEYKRGSRKRSLYLVNENYVGDILGMEINWQRWLTSGGSGVLSF